MLSCQRNIYEKLCKSCLDSCQLYYVRKSHSLDFKIISRQEIKNYSNACQHYLLNAKAFQWPLLSDVNYASDNTAFQVPAKTKPINRYLPQEITALLYNSVSLLTTLHTKFWNNPLEVEFLQNCWLKSQPVIAADTKLFPGWNYLLTMKIRGLLLFIKCQWDKAVISANTTHLSQGIYSTH